MRYLRESIFAFRRYNAKSKIQTGYISELEKVYIFTYDGELLQLVPKEKNEIKPYDFLNNSNKNLEILEGETQSGNKIFI